MSQIFIPDRCIIAPRMGAVQQVLLSQKIATGGGGFALVQSKAYGSTASSATHTITPDSTPTSGNLLVITASADEYIASLSGWTRQVVAENITGAYLFWKISAGNETSIAVSLGSSTSCALHFFEYSGMTATPYDVSASSAGQSASSLNSGTTAAIAQATELGVAFISMSSGGTIRNATSWSNSYAEVLATTTTGSATNVRLETATRDITVQAAQSTVATLDGSTTLASAGIATFKKT